MALLLFLILSLSAYLFYHLYYKRRRLPPGPTPLPVIGNVLGIRRYGPGEDSFLKWRRQYGPVYTYWMGYIPVVCVADYPKMVEMLVKDADTLVDRYILPFEEYIRRGKGGVCGVISSSGPLWREQRRFALHVFRDFGLGKNLMQERIMDELSGMFAKIDSNWLNQTDEEIDLLKHIDLAVGSIINNVMFGYRLDGEKEAEFWKIKHLLDDHMRSFASPLVAIYLCYPTLFNYIPPFSGVGRKVVMRLQTFFAYFVRKIDEHRNELEASGEWDAPAKDYVDAYLKEMHRRENMQDGREHFFYLKQCSNMCFDLWVAGQETTSTTLAWAIAYLLNHEHCVQRMCAELDAQIGSDRMVTVADKQALPYTNAVVNESLRVGNIISTNLMRATSRDLNINGYVLPKGICVIPQISAVLIDDTVFPEPKSFKPERFLDKDGKLIKCDELIPFSIGKRQCLGESLARMELFLFIANIYNRYKILPGKEMPSLVRPQGIIVNCQPFSCRMEKRKMEH